MKIKTIIIGLGIAGIAAIIGFTPVEEPEPLTVNEWQAITKIYDYEIEKAGGLQIKDFTSQNAIKKLNAEIRKREPTENIEIDGQEMTPQNYKTFRDNLLEKTEQKTLIEKIIK